MKSLNSGGFPRAPCSIPPSIGCGNMVDDARSEVYFVGPTQTFTSRTRTKSTSYTSTTTFEIKHVAGTECPAAWVYIENEDHSCYYAQYPSGKSLDGTPQGCARTCCKLGGTSLPFVFAFNKVTRDCHCSPSTQCIPQVNSNFTVYMVKKPETTSTTTQTYVGTTMTRLPVPTQLVPSPQDWLDSHNRRRLNASFSAGGPFKDLMWSNFLEKQAKM